MAKEAVAEKANKDIVALSDYIFAKVIIHPKFK